jgi:uncharacterized protein YidB (DUF937 family)
MGGAPGPNQNAATAAGGNNGALMAALLPIALAMLRGQTAGGGAPAGAGGGLGGMLGSVLGGGGLGNVLGGMLGGNSGGAGAGLGGLLEQFQRAGFGDHAASWVGTGENKPLPPDAMGQVLGNDAVANIAKQAGVTEADASAGLGQLLPQLIDHLTPNGQMPSADQLAKSLEAFGLHLG